MASISVGSVSVDVVPSVRDFASRMRREMLPQATEVGREVGRRIQQGIEREVKPVSVRVTTGSSVTRLERLKKLLEEIDGKTVNVQVNVDIGGSLVELRALAALLNRLNGRRINININTEVAAAQAQIAAMQAQLRSMDSRKTININVDVGGALAAIFSVRAALIGLGVISLPAIAGIGAGIAGLVGPLSAAGAGFGAFAGVAIPSVMRVREALQAQQAAEKQGAQVAQQAQSQALAAAGARQQLAAAVRNSAYAHQQALEQVRQAETQLAQAQRAARQAQEDLNRARVDARRGLQDMANQVASARLDERQAVFDVQDAERELAKLRADPKASRDQVARQELAADQARQRLSEQRLTLQRLALDEKAARKAGVEGSDQVRAARDRLADANARITESERGLAAARANVARVDQQSADSVAAARRALTQATSGSAAAVNNLGFAMARLTPLERDLMQAWQGLTAAGREWATSLQPDVIPVLIKGITLLKNLLPTFTPLVRGAAAGISELLDRASAAAKSPFWTQFAQFMGRSVAPAIVQLGTLAGHLLTAFAGIAQGFMPIGMAFLQVLNAVFQRFAAFTTGLTSNPAFQQFVAQFTAAIPLMVETFSALGSLIGSLFAALAPAMAPILEFIRSLAANLAGVLRAVGPAIQSVFGALGSALSAVLTALAPVVTQLVQALAPLLVQLINGLKPILIALAPVIGQLLVALAPVVSALISGLQPILAALVPLLGGLAAAVTPVWAVIASLLQPIGQLIASLINGLMPVLMPIINMMAGEMLQVWTAFGEVLRQSIPAIQQIVLAVASLLPALLPLVPLWAEWLTTILPLLPALTQLAAALITLLVPVLRLMITIWVRVVTTIAGLVLPVWRLMVTVIVWVAGILTTILNGIGAVFRVLGQAAMWLWTNAIKPAFTFIAALARWLYSIIAFTVIAPLVIQFKVFAAIVKWLWGSVISPSFKLIGNFIRATWTGVIRPTLTAIGNWLRNTLTPVIRWFYHSIVRPLWNAVGTAIRSVWNTFIRPTFDGIKSALNRLAPYFRTAVSAISKAWSGLKEAAKKPVSFVVNTVFNSGIVKIWDAVAKLVPGMKRLEPIRGFARGGVMPGYAPGRDKLLAAVSPGESIFRPEFTKAVGEKFVTGANSAARSGGVAGVVRFLGMAGDPGLGPGFAGHFALGGIVGGFLKAAKGWFAKGLVKTAAAAFNPLVTSAQRAIGGTGFGDLAVNAVRGLTSRILSYFGPLEKKIGGGGSMGAVRAARAVIGTPYSWGGGGPHGPSRGFGRGANTAGFDCSSLMQYGWYQAAHKVMPRTTYTQRPWLRRIGKPVPGAVGQPHPGHTYMYSGNGKIIEAPFTGGFVREVPMRSTPFWGLPPWKFDNGGWLPTGVSMVYNGTGSPEPVLTTAQLDRITGTGTGGPRTGPLMNVENQYIGEGADIDLIAHRLEFAARSATFG